MLVFFCASCAVVGWVYFGYPLALKCGLFGRAQERPHNPQLRAVSPLPLISVLIPAHNEEAGIEAKLGNVLDSDYPRDRIEILVGSDGSSDRTEDIVEHFRNSGVGLISFPRQYGKSAIQNGLVAVASGSILVFTDADCLLTRDALRRLIEPFTDPSVGLVTGAPRYRNTHETPTAANESLYLRYETWLRKLESERGLLAMASGSLFAMRRSLWQPLPRQVGDDFALPLRVARGRLRNVLETRAAPVTDLAQSSPRAMFRLKVRVISKDLSALLQNRALLNPLRYAAISATLWSHKLLRWLVPYFLVLLFTSNLFLLDHSFFQTTLVLQSTFYALAIAGLVAPGKLRWPLWRIPLSFCVVNCAAAFGILKALTGRASGAWEPERRYPVPVRPLPTRTPRIEI